MDGVGSQGLGFAQADAARPACPPPPEAAPVAQAAAPSPKPWEANCAVRERKEYLLTSSFPTALMLPWSIFDWVLEPALARSFLWLRVIDFAVGGVIILGLVRANRTAHPLGMARLFGALRIGLAGVLIAIMCAGVSTPHYFPYVLGFSLVFWAMGIGHTWPIRWSLGTLAAVLGSYFVARLRFGVARPAVEEVAALFYLGSTCILCIAAIEIRRRLHYQAFLATQELDLRNRELSTTLASLRATQARLVEGEKLSALGRLISSLSHEINNPVNVLRHNLEPLSRYFEQMAEVLTIARAGGDLNAAWEEHDLDFVLQDCIDAVATMAQGIQRIHTVHAEMRAFVRGDAPLMQLADVNEGLRATANMLRRSLPEGITIRVDCGVLPQVLFQPGQMNQVFFNLIQNAVDAIEGARRAGTILVRSDAAEDAVRLTVEDTGPGVSAWAREHLFEPFFTTKPPGKGTGLGLAISYQIVQRHGGRIELDDSYREGARFVVSLPVPPAP